jgi:EmrB/QacA subfamily drug resistance transporter
MHRRLLAATILGSSMAFLDGTAVNVALPLLQRDLRATISGVQWVVEAYALLLAALILAGGALGDVYGRKRVFGLGVALFAITSAACGLAPSIGVLIAARALQGIAGALLVPGSLAIISAAFDDDSRARAIGVWSSLTALTAILGPVVGGWLADRLSWRWVFYINVPLAIAVLLLLRGVRESRDDAARRLDIPGALLASVALGCVTYALTEWKPGRSALVAVFALGVALFVAFVVVERRTREPMLPPSVFRSRTFSAANLLTLLLYAALSATMFFLPFNLIGVQHYSATEAGAANLPMIALISTLSPLSGRFAARHGWRGPLIVGPLVAACGFALFAFVAAGGNYWRTFFPAALVLGLGMAITVAPLTTAVMSSCPREHAGIASGINNAVSRAAGLLAIAAIGLCVAAVFRASLASALQPLDAATRAHVLAQSARLTDIPATGAVRLAINAAFVHAYRIAMLVCAALGVLAAACGALTKRSTPQQLNRSTAL